MITHALRVTIIELILESLRNHVYLFSTTRTLSVQLRPPCRRTRSPPNRAPTPTKLLAPSMGLKFLMAKLALKLIFMPGPVITRFASDRAELLMAHFTFKNFSTLQALHLSPPSRKLGQLTT